MSATDMPASDADGWDSLPEQLKNDTFLQVMRELAVVRGHDRPMLLVAHGFIEMAVDELVKQNAKNGKAILRDNRSYPHSIKLLLLHELDVISDGDFRVLNWFRRLRNRAAHEALFLLKDSDFTGVRAPNIPDPANDLHRFLIYLLAGFWNSHLTVLGPIFAPGTLGLAEDEKPESK